MRSPFVNSKELKELIEKYPDCEFFMDEVFSYPIDNKYNIVFTNQRKYEEWLYDKIADECEEIYGDSAGTYIDKQFEKKLKEYEKYWQKCIVISAGSRLWDDYES